MPFEMELGLHVGQHITFSLCQLFFVFALLILFCIVVVVAPRRRLRSCGHYELGREEHQLWYHLRQVFLGVGLVSFLAPR